MSWILDFTSCARHCDSSSFEFEVESELEIEYSQHSDANNHRHYDPHFWSHTVQENIVLQTREPRKVDHPLYPSRVWKGILQAWAERSRMGLKWQQCHGTTSERYNAI